jgi:hypothetical protein
MAFAGTISLTPETFITLLRNLAQSLARHGFRKVLFMNGHGGNDPALGVAVQRIYTGVESRAGAVAERSGAVHALGCRLGGPATGLRLQPPLIKPGVRFSRTRLSEVLHRAALGAAGYHRTVPCSRYSPSPSK